MSEQPATPPSIPRPAGGSTGRGGPQLIPRPDSARPGPGAPWSQAEATAPSVVTVADVRRAMAPGGPGPSPRGTDAVPLLAGETADEGVRGEAVRGEAVRGEAVRGEAVGGGTRPAAVLCALFDESGQAHVLLTRRSSLLRSHTGEVSFPGGRLDPGETPEAAALREAYEEVGLLPSSVELLGRLSLVSTRRNPSAITPFVGALAGRPVLRPNQAEVDRAFTVPVVELYQPDVYHEELWRGDDGVDWPVTFFDVVGDTVWGATGRMLRELLDLIWTGAEQVGGDGRTDPGAASGSGGRTSSLGMP